MNRYIITALYVMAGCAVTVPLKAQTNAEPLKVERCRLIITSTIKIIAEYIDEETIQDTCGLSSDFFPFQKYNNSSHTFFLDKDDKAGDRTLCRTSHKIRAPGRI